MRELLNNVVRHANASQVIVRLEQDVIEHKDLSSKMTGWVLIPDSGSQGVTREGAFGLFSIQERMSDLGGILEINSQPGEGSQAILAAPNG